MTHSASYRRILHKMGFYNYQQGLIYRHLKQGEGWTTHESRCRSFIIKAIEYYKPAKVTVLGSGWLMELPLTEMAEKAEIITLVDIIHPPEVISQTAGLKNVTLVPEDITGGLITEVWTKSGKRMFLNKLKSLDKISVPEYTLSAEADLVISLNILTQLETLPVNFLRKKCKASEDEFMMFRKTVQKNHIDFLKKHRSVLISDIAEVFTRSGGDSYQTETILTDLPEGKIKDEWIWDFDLAGSDFNRKRSVLKVAAILL